jgi:general secretion pathway protein B
MSYILDALRKADAQRERDPARGIHAQPARHAMGEGRPGNRFRAGMWAAVVAGLVALASISWYLYQDRAASPMPAPARAEQAPALVPAPVAVVVAPPIQVAPAVLPAPAPPPSDGPGANLGPSGGDPRNSSIPTMRAGPQPPTTTVAPTPAAIPATSPPVTPVPVSQPSATAAVTGLPPDAPKLAISGGVYSADRAQRMLIVNGQVFTEGSDLGSGVVLEEIKAKSAVLRFRGARYAITY